MWYFIGMWPFTSAPRFKSLPESTRNTKQLTWDNADGVRRFWRSSSCYFVYVHMAAQYE